MQIIKVFITLSFLFLEDFSFAVENSQNLNLGQKNLASHFSFDYSYVNSNINHSETSTDISFTPLNEDVNLMVHYLSVGYEYEVFAKSLFSLTAHLSAGLQSGEDVHDNEGSSGAVDFFEKALGHHGGAGLTFNWNTSNSFGKIQYFLGVRSISSKTKFFLRYRDDNSTKRSDEIQYDVLQTISESSVGFRSFTFSDKNLYSIISINKLNFSVQDLSAQASAGKTKYSLNKLAEFKNQEYSIRLGFGFLY